MFQLDNIKEKSKKTKREKYGDENYNNPEKNKKNKILKHGENYYKDWYKKVENTLKDEYDVTHGLQLQKFKDKKTKTTIEKYGVENVSQNEDVKTKRTKTIKKRFGVENASQNEQIKEKKKQTSMDNFGVSHHLKDYDMFEKHLKAQYKIKKYKDTNLNYQGTYEKHFLEKMEEIEELSNVRSGKSYKYIFEGKDHVYHTDFFYKDFNIEIKSGWTYNKNGKDKKLEDINRTKWKSVVEFGDKIKVMFSKNEIDLFVSGIV